MTKFENLIYRMQVTQAEYMRGLLILMQEYMPLVLHAIQPLIQVLH